MKRASSQKLAQIGNEREISQDDEKVHLKRDIDLVGAIFVIIGCQIGSGIFISPKGGVYVCQPNIFGENLFLAKTIFCKFFSSKKN